MYDNLKRIICLCTFFLYPPSNAEEISKFIVVGHAYGSHHLHNKGLDDRVISFFKSKNLPPETPIFLTGDFIRKCNKNNWDILSSEFEELNISPFLIRGSHERKSFCTKKIKERHGSINYSFETNGSLILVSDTVNKNRTFSKKKISNIDKELQKTTSNNVFIFTHHLVWLSDQSRYGIVRANHGSRGNKIEKSNYWPDVHPMLTKYPDKNIYIIAGDVGGRPDAIAAHYDKVENVTFIASGIGEISYNAALIISISANEINFTLESLEHPHTKHIITDYQWPRP